MVKEVRIPIEEMNLQNINEAVNFADKMKTWSNSLEVVYDGEKTYIVSRECMDFSIFNSSVNEKISNLQKEMEAIKLSAIKVVEVAENLTPLLELIKGKQTEEKKIQELPIPQELVTSQEQSLPKTEEKHIETSVPIDSFQSKASQPRPPIPEQSELEKITENSEAEEKLRKNTIVTRLIEYKCKECGEISKFDVPFGIKAKQVTCKNCGKIIYYNENLKTKKSRAKQYVLFAALCIFTAGVLISKYVAHLF